MNNILVDSHCHLNLLQEAGEELPLVIQRAMKNNVQYLQTICTTLDDLPVLIGIIEEYSNVFASVGIHPCEVNKKNAVPIGALELVTLADHPKIIGIGETGLDYYHPSYNRQLQIKSFVEHIHSSQIAKLPIIVHTRDAESDTQDLLISEMKNSPFSGLIHCFTASRNFARKMLDIGLYISVSGIITFKNAIELQEIVKYIPLDRLLIETDSPYLAPVPMRGRCNEPSYVMYVAEKIAELKMVDSASVAYNTSKNFFNLFTKCKAQLFDQ